MKKRMKKEICAAFAAMLIAMVSLPALADVQSPWMHSALNGYVQFSNQKGGFDGYASADSCGGVTTADPYYVTVISRNASVWSEPWTNSRKLGSVSHGDSLLCCTQEDAYDLMMCDGFYAVEYQGKDGWINEDYVISNELTITLLESNVPAYIAPDESAKKVGSLGKLTKHRVIGFYDDYYIVNLRGAAAAFIPMSVRHRDNLFDRYYHGGGGMREKAKTLGRVSLRTGPDDSYPEIRVLQAGKEVEVFDIIDGWYMIADEETGEWAFIEPGMLDEENLWQNAEWESNG